MQLNDTFIDEINKLLPSKEAAKIIDSISSQDPVTSVRLNSFKGFKPIVELEPVPWCPYGAYLNIRPQFTFSPLFHAGSYYVQDASSMFIHHVIKNIVKTPVTYLDLCAAPGGKTTTALQALPTGSTVVANEIVPTRAQILKENVIKWGTANCMVTCDSPKTIGALKNAFDVIAADVPCSGEGMFRKDPEAVSQWSPALVEQCATRQRQILSDVWSALKPDGVFIYSTCTYNKSENEEIVDFIINELGATVIDIPIPSSWHIHPAIDRAYSCYRFMPHLSRGEGLFMCVLRKNNASYIPEHNKKKKSKNNKTTVAPNFKDWIEGDFSIINNDDNVTAVPNAIIKDSLEDCWQKLHIIKQIGVELGTLKGKKIIPSHQLAMSTHLAKDAFQCTDVDYATAIAYLRGEAITINAPHGYVLIKYENAPLGWVNNLGTRANNLYPKPWRITSTHIPLEPPELI